MSRAQELPVVEIFDSIQGEGAWQGTPMSFVRLAGCNVGRYAQLGEKYPKCVSWNGSTFRCDTDYRSSEIMSVQDIAARAQLPHVCVTGGEPFVHHYERLVELAGELWGCNPDCEIHFETNGTKPLAPFAAFFDEQELSSIWITCSPKLGFLKENVPFIIEL